VSDAVEKLKPLVASLAVEELYELLEYIEERLPPPNPDDDFDPEYRAELDRRLEDMRSGKDPGMPAEEFMRQMREKYG
jgi:putative addiction module component (TIGR02574 family)